MGLLERLWSLLLGRSEWALRGAVLQSLRTILAHPHMAETTLEARLREGLAAHATPVDGSSNQVKPQHATVRQNAHVVR